MNTVHFINNSYLYQKIYDLLTGAYFPDLATLLGILAALLEILRPYSLILSLLLLTGVIYSSIRTRAIIHEIEAAVNGNEREDGRHADAREEAPAGAAAHAERAAETASHANPRWEKILIHINSENPSDWRLAILECDIILDEMLTKMSYHGETLSDKLKAVEKSDFLSIEKAWEAHRVRNAIAHEGSNFQITAREARLAVGLYEDVFKEFHYI